MKMPFSFLYYTKGFFYYFFASFGPSEVLGCCYSRVALCALSCTIGSSLLQINESPVCSLEKTPQVLACHWLLACLKVT